MSVAERLADGEVLRAEPAEDSTHPVQHVRQVSSSSYEALREGHGTRRWSEKELRWLLNTYPSVEFVTLDESPFGTSEVAA